MLCLFFRYGTVRTFDAAHPQPKSKPAPVHVRDDDDDEDEEDEEEYEEMLAEAGAKRDRLSERLIVSAAAAAASQAATALPPLALSRPDNRRNSYPSPLTEHSFSQDDSDMYWSAQRVFINLYLPPLRDFCNFFCLKATECVTQALI